MKAKEFAPKVSDLGIRLHNSFLKFSEYMMRKQEMEPISLTDDSFSD